MLGNLLTVLVLTITTGFRRVTQSQVLTTGIVCLAVLSHDSRLELRFGRSCLTIHDWGVSGFTRVLGLKCTSHVFTATIHDATTPRLSMTVTIHD